MWNVLRILVVSLVISCPIVLVTGCGAISGGDDAENELRVEEDETQNPETDSTMVE